MRYPRIRSGIIVITGKIVTAATRILAIKANTTTKNPDNKSGNRWEHKERDSKITLLHKSPHFVPAKFSESFFKQFNLAMKLKKEELRKQEKVEVEVSEVTEEDVAKVFGVTKDHMLEAAKILQAEENTEKLCDSSV